MKAIAVHPGQPNTMHLRNDVPEPRVGDVPDGRGVLVKVVRVGVDGTDKEINAAEYGDAPQGSDYLITGHEALGRVVEVGPGVPSHIQPGSIVVATVRRPGMSVYDSIGLQDMTTDDVYFERGINKRHGYLCEYYVEDFEYITTLPACLNETGVLLEPLTVAEKAINQAFEIQRRLKVWQPRRAAVLGSGTVGLLTTLALRLRGIEVTCISLRPAPYLNSDLIEEIGGTYVSTEEISVAEAGAEHGPFDIVVEATGFSPLVWQGAEVLAKNGVLVLVSVTGGGRTVEIPSDAINQGFVLGNKVMVGSVNASPEDFARGRDDLVKAYAFYPGWLEKLLTTPVHGLESYEQMLRELTENKDAIKVFVQVERQRGSVNGAAAAAAVEA
ncbi:MAG TPA: glucose 1-dehydrogenase [Thermoleophilaceae bacterium]|nr:glucose 1-dehydrogenase [Thermoleophilaceae bacterium]